MTRLLVQGCNNNKYSTISSISNNNKEEKEGKKTTNGTWGIVFLRYRNSIPNTKFTSSSFSYFFPIFIRFCYTANGTEKKDGKKINMKIEIKKYIYIYI